MRTRPIFAYQPDQADQNLGLNQTKPMKIGVLARPNRPKYAYCPDQTNRNMDFNQTEHTESRVLATHRNMGICQVEIWVLARLTSGYQTDQTGRRPGFAQSEKFEIRVLPIPNRPK